MPVNYGVLRGKVIDAIPYKKGADHYQVEVKADNLYRIAVDVYSQFAGTKQRYAADNNNTLDTDRMVMYYKDENYTHPITATILNCAEGFTAKADMDPALYLDFLRFNNPTPLFPLNEMKVVAPKDQNGEGDDLNDDIDPWIQKAKNNPNAEVFAFGSGWDDNAPGANADPKVYFNPNPSLGIHDIHMNQGDSGKEAKYNGVGQDGALFIYFSDTNLWVAMFFRFQVQSLNTDADGNALQEQAAQ